MKINKKSLILLLLAVTISVLVVVAIVKAATSLTPPPYGSPGAAVDVTGAPVGTMHTLDDIYNSITPPLAWQSYDGNCSTPDTATACQYDSDCPGSGETCNVLSLCGNANYCSVNIGLVEPYTTPLGATEYCNYLEANGSTVAASPQNIWRLPTPGELLKGLSDGFITNTAGGGFYGNSYWSFTTFGSTNYYTAGYQGYIPVNSGDPSTQNLVRCVHNTLPKTPGSATCGDGIVESGEACDNGVNNGTDGCMTGCTAVESGWTCTDTVGLQSVCTFVPLGPGGACTRNSQCQYHNCDTVNGVCGGQTYVASCSVNTDCASDYCDTYDGVCSNGATGVDACGSGTDCVSDNCSNNICTISSGGGLGADCSTDGDCAGYICGSDLKCDAVTWQKGGKCSVTTADLCNVNSDCPSGQTCHLNSNLMVWSSTYGSPDAQTYCANLDADQVEQSSAQGIWEVPSIPVLIQGLNNQFTASPPSLGGFQDSGYYWSSTPVAAFPGRAWVAYGFGGYVYGNFGGEYGYFLVRCVH